MGYGCCTPRLLAARRRPISLSVRLSHLFCRPLPRDSPVHPDPPIKLSNPVTVTVTVTAPSVSCPSPVLSCPVLSVSCPVLSCPVLSCPVPSRPVPSVYLSTRLPIPIYLRRRPSIRPTFPSVYPVSRPFPGHSRRPICVVQHVPSSCNTCRTVLVPRRCSGSHPAAAADRLWVAAVGGWCACRPPAGPSAGLLLSEPFNVAAAAAVFA